MIHPDSGNVVPVRYELALPAADDRCIASVDPHAAIIVNQHLPHIIRLHNKQRQTVLPQIPPASAALTVIMMRQERTPVDPAEHGLEINPEHEIVKIRLGRLIGDIDLIQPVCTRLLKGFQHLRTAFKFRQHPVDHFLLLFRADKYRITPALPRLQRYPGKTKRSNDLITVIMSAGCIIRKIL